MRRLLQRQPLRERAGHGASLMQRRPRLFQQHAQQRCDPLAHVAPVDDHVERAVIEQELAALEALGQRLAHRLLDHARAGEADERARLGEIEVAEHREARRHAAGGRIGHDRDERQMRLREARERRGGLRHLQQRVKRLLHAGAAARGEADERLAMLDAVVGAALEALPHHRAHRAAEKLELEGAGHHRQLLERARQHDERIGLAGRLLCLDEPILVALAVAELQRILGRDPRPELLGRGRIEEPLEALAAADAHVMAALRTDVQIALELRPIEHGIACRDT